MPQPRPHPLPEPVPEPVPQPVPEPPPDPDDPLPEPAPSPLDNAMVELGVHGSIPGESVRHIMTCPVTTMHQREGVFDVTQHMMRHSVRRMPVVNDDGQLVGLVTLDDLLVLLSRELDQLAQGVRGEVAAPQG